MGLLHSSSNEQKAYLFSIPIMFCVLLFVLLYWFYIHNRASAFSHNPPLSPTITSSSSFSFPNIPILVSPRSMPVSVPDEFDFEDLIDEEFVFGDLRDELPTVEFDEELKAKDSVCCICLGEFEMNEELIQVPSCKHIFHIYCIRNWLISNDTCPLCRCLVDDVDDTERVIPPPHTSPAEV